MDKRKNKYIIVSASLMLIALVMLAIFIVTNLEQPIYGRDPDEVESVENGETEEEQVPIDDRVKTVIQQIKDSDEFGIPAEAETKSKTSKNNAKQNGFINRIMNVFSGEPDDIDASKEEATTASNQKKEQTTKAQGFFKKIINKITNDEEEKLVTDATEPKKEETYSNGNVTTKKSTEVEKTDSSTKSEITSKENEETKQNTTKMSTTKPTSTTKQVSTTKSTKVTTTKAKKVTTTKVKKVTTTKVQRTTTIPDTTSRDISDQIDFDYLKNECADIVAWIDIPNTVICYPVVRRKSDDSYYLNRNIYGKYSKFGTLFIEGRNNPNFTDNVTVIYGHYTSTGAMFGSLQEMYSSAEGLAKNPYINIYTPSGKKTYKVYGGAITDSKHILATYDFSNKTEFNGYFDNVMNSRTLTSAFDVTAKPTFGDNVLILSTCLSNDSSKRFIVIAKLV